MKLRIMIVCLAMAAGSAMAVAQNTQQDVEKGIAQVEQLATSHQWHEAFVKLYAVERAAEGNVKLQYLAAKERYGLYVRLRKPADMTTSMTRMEQLAMRSGDTKLIEDMLHQKAAYHATRGEAKQSHACYEQMLARRQQGKDDKGREAAMKGMISEAEGLKNALMKQVAEDAWRTWQDSVAAVRAQQELTELKADYAAAQEDIDAKQSKISLQWGTIMLLLALLGGAAAAVVALLTLLLKNNRQRKALSRMLEETQQGSRQKSVFMRNIGSQIAPSLSAIAAGDVRTHVKALERMMQDVETYAGLDDTRTDPYETTPTDVAKLCQKVVEASASVGVPVENEAAKLSFPVPEEAVATLLQKVVSEAAVSPGTERIKVGFRKRTPKTGEFSVTAIGMKLDEAQQDKLFTAFARVYDLTRTTGLALPICSVMATKMNGTLSLDTAFAKGIRFLLTVGC